MENKIPDLNMKIRLIGILHSDVKREDFPSEQAFITEKDAIKDAQAVAVYIEKLGIKTKLYPGNKKLSEELRKDKPDMVINLVSSIHGYDYLASTIPGVLELLEIPYTGAGILGEALSYNKYVVKKLLEQNGLPVPHFQLFRTHTDLIDPTLRYPLISKLNEVHGGVEIDINAISENEKHLRERLKHLIETYKQPVLVEEYIAGREITAILLEGLNRKVYLAEKAFKDKDSKYIFTKFEDTWEDEGDLTFEYQKFQDPLLNAYIRKAFDITKMTDYGKFDIRMDISGRYHFTDCNSNPAFGPIENDCALAYILDMYGVSFNEVLRRLIINTLKP